MAQFCDNNYWKPASSLESNLDIDELMKEMEDDQPSKAQ